MNITARTALLAVIGDPVGHSLSPVLHNGWIADHGLDAVFVALSLRSEDPVGAIRALKQFALKGASVTLPFKQAAARAADAYGAAAANTLRWEASGALTAFNTDGAGFVDALAEAAPDWRQRVKRALILGAGGAAHGIAEALAGAAEIVIANRTAPRAASLASALAKARAEPWEKLPELFAGADLIVNATTLGMAGAPNLDWPLAHAKADALVADIVYRPLETRLLARARQRGLIAIDGLGMLIHQGARAFEIWFGIRPDVKLARARLLAALGEDT